MTACAKNYVGIVLRKECLPHHTLGSLLEQGDEHLKKSVIKNVADWFLDQWNIAAYTNSKLTALYRRIFDRLEGYNAFYCREHFSEGNWYGNDTIWRTVVNLNRIVRYASKVGVLEQTLQRSIFNICDMIISGEKEGPMLPSPKPMGIIMMGESGAALDCVICRIVGFDAAKVKYICPMMEMDQIHENDIRIVDAAENVYSVSEFRADSKRFWVPSKGWEGHIEGMERVFGNPRNECRKII